MKDSVVGCVLGTAVGDALGLPYEGMNPRRICRMFSELGRHHLLLNKGMVSDDTEHTCFVAQAVLRSGGDPEVFLQYLAKSLRWWLLCLPAGVGMATLRAVIKLWVGFSPRKSGVFSAGNGPAMRSPILGVLLGATPERLKTFVRASTEVTHNDPKAYFGAMGIALAAFLSSRGLDVQPLDFVIIVKTYLPETEAGEFVSLVEMAAESAIRKESSAEFVMKLGCRKGVSGYIFHTVPCVLQTWLRFQEDFKGALLQIFEAGGDTDTTGAILGGIVGARVGKSGIPLEWLDGIIEWPRTVHWMEKLAAAVAPVADGYYEVECPRYFWPGVIPRNILFLLVVLMHGFRRLLPPY